MMKVDIKPAYKKANAKFQVGDLCYHLNRPEFEMILILKLVDSGHPMATDEYLIYSLTDNRQFYWNMRYTDTQFVRFAI